MAFLMPKMPLFCLLFRLSHHDVANPDPPVYLNYDKIYKSWILLMHIGRSDRHHPVTLLPHSVPRSTALPTHLPCLSRNQASPAGPAGFPFAIWTLIQMNGDRPLAASRDLDGTSCFIPLLRALSPLATSHCPHSRSQAHCPYHPVHQSAQLTQSAERSREKEARSATPRLVSTLHKFRVRHRVGPCPACAMRGCGDTSAWRGGVDTHQVSGRALEARLQPGTQQRKELTMNTTTQTNSTGSSLVEKFSLAGVHVSIWVNTSHAGVRYPSTKIERRYKDANGDYQSTDSYSRDALPVVADLATRAHARIKELEKDPNGPFSNPAQRHQRTNGGR